jgi:hypothetical protein
MKIKSRFTKIAIASGLVVATGASVLGITGFASAQMAARDNGVAISKAVNSAPQASQAIQVTETTVPAAGATAAAALPEEADRPSPLAGVAKTLGITEEALKAELTSGKSIADVAKAKNIDIATVIAAMKTEFKAHLDAEVASGEHTQAEADAKLAEFDARATKMVNTAGLPPRGEGHGPGGRGGMKGGPGAIGSEAVAKSLNLTAAELRTQLQSGKSLADIATAQKVDIAEVKKAVLADVKAHLATEVTSGEHTQAEADAKLAEITANIDNMVNKVRPAGEMRGEGHGPGGMKGGPMGTPPTNGTATNTSASA